MIIETANILLGGLAAGMVLFIVSVGLSVTLGLMGFVNLAHGGFAMLGGYVIVLAMKQLGVPFLAALACGFIIIAAVSAAFERLLYARLYRAPELDQVLLTIGLVFVMIASITLTVGPETQPLTLPASMQGQLNLGFMQYRTYSVVLILAGVVIMLGLWLSFERTRIGAPVCFRFRQITKHNCSRTAEETAQEPPVTNLYPVGLSQFEITMREGP